MKQFVVLAFVCLCANAYGLGHARPEVSLLVNSDTLKAKLAELQTKVDSLQKRLEKVQVNKDLTARKNQSEALKKGIREQQIAAIRVCALYMDRYAAGTKATDNILGALNTGIKMGTLASPFSNVSFREDYDKWGDKWGKFLPAIVLPLASVLAKSDQETQVVSVSVGLSVTAIWNALSKSNKNQDAQISNAINKVTQTMDLFDFNRTVFDENQKLVAVIKSVNDADPSLWTDFKRYWEKNKDIITMSNDQISKDLRFPTFIDSTTVYLDRFQLKLARVNYVLDYAKSMIDSYGIRYLMVKPDDTNAVTIETKKAIDDLREAYANNSVDWDELQGTFYKMTPGELRKLNSFHQLEDLYRQIPF